MDVNLVPKTSPLSFSLGQKLSQRSWERGCLDARACADDQQLYSADSDHATLHASLDHKSRETSQWFKRNGLMANPSKFQ